MFGHLFDNTYTGTRAERCMRDSYDRARRGAHHAYDAAADRLHSWRDYLPHFSSRQTQPSHHHGYISDAAGALCCFLTGAAVMYFFDPQMGRRRRTLVRDKFISAGHCASDTMRTTGQHLANRSRGLYHETARKFRHDGATDRVLCERVRSHLGRSTSKASSLQIRAEDGCVTLNGSVLESELDGVLAAVRGVPGVSSVVNNLQARSMADQL